MKTNKKTFLRKPSAIIFLSAICLQESSFNAMQDPNFEGKRSGTPVPRRTGRFDPSAMARAVAESRLRTGQPTPEEQRRATNVRAAVAAVVSAAGSPAPQRRSPVDLTPRTSPRLPDSRPVSPRPDLAALPNVVPSPRDVPILSTSAFIRPPEVSVEPSGVGAPVGRATPPIIDASNFGVQDLPLPPAHLAPGTSEATSATLETQYFPPQQESRSALLEGSAESSGNQGVAVRAPVEFFARIEFDAPAPVPLAASLSAQTPAEGLVGAPPAHGLIQRLEPAPASDSSSTNALPAAPQNTPAEEAQESAASSAVLANASVEARPSPVTARRASRPPSLNFPPALAPAADSALTPRAVSSAGRDAEPNPQPTSPKKPIFWTTNKKVGLGLGIISGALIGGVCILKLGQKKEEQNHRALSKSRPKGPKRR